jgi:hypothetical protein
MVGVELRVLGHAGGGGVMEELAEEARGGGVASVGAEESHDVLADLGGGGELVAAGGGEQHGVRRRVGEGVGDGRGQLVGREPHPAAGVGRSPAALPAESEVR